MIREHFPQIGRFTSMHHRDENVYSRLVCVYVLYTQTNPGAVAPELLYLDRTVAVQHSRLGTWPDVGASWSAHVTRKLLVPTCAIGTQRALDLSRGRLEAQS